MINTHNAPCGFLKMNLAKIPAISMENGQQTSFFFSRRPMSPKIILTKGKESKTRKSEEKERRRRAKGKGCAIILAT